MCGGFDDWSDWLRIGCGCVGGVTMTCPDCGTTLTDMGPRCEDCITKRCLHCRATLPQCQGLQNRFTVRCCQGCFHASSGENEGGT